MGNDDRLDDDWLDDGDLATWVAEAATDDVVADRVRRARRRRVDAASLTLRAVLEDLAERGAGALVRIEGRTHRGRVEGVGVALVALRTTRGRLLLDVARVSAVQPDDGVPVAPRRPEAERTAAERDVDLVAVLADLLDERPRLHLGLAGDPEPLVGTLLGVGDDLVTLRGEHGAVVHVAVQSISEVLLTDSG